MTLRYNPHSIEKQARKWPVFINAESLEEDLSLRTRQIYETGEIEFNKVTEVSFPFDQNLVCEYGHDCSRIAFFSTQQNQLYIDFLENSFKWLSKIFNRLNLKRDQPFNYAKWLELSLQSCDHILKRQKHYTGLNCIKKAVKIAPLSKNLRNKELLLVCSALYPFAPYFSQWIAQKNNLENILSLKKIVELFPELKVTRFSFNNGGKHWAVFSRKSFEKSPMNCFFSIKWVKHACRSLEPKLKFGKEEIKICLK